MLFALSFFSSFDIEKLVYIVLVHTKIIPSLDLHFIYRALRVGKLLGVVKLLRFMFNKAKKMAGRKMLAYTEAVEFTVLRLFFEHFFFL